MENNIHKISDKNCLYHISLKIRKLFKDKKYKEVIKLASTYLEFFPDDQVIRFMRAKSYRKLCKFDEAVEDLKYNLSVKYNEHSLTELYFLYYYLNRYQEAIELLPLVYKTRCINAYSVSISELVMKTQLRIDVKVSKGDKCDYIRSQIFNYSTSSAFDHIQEHTSLGSIDITKSYFNENIDLDYLFRVVRENIDNNKKYNTEETLELHYFAIPNVGYQGNNTCNFIKVVVIPNTNKIITMYPVLNVDYDCLIDIDYEKLFKREPQKVKTVSQIDKFNARYKR